MERKPEELLELCRGKKIFIQTHNFPDPDAIGASFGLQQLLQHFGIESQLCHEGQIDKLSARKMLNLCGIAMYPYAELEGSMTEGDMIILVDCQKNTVLWQEGLYQRKLWLPWEQMCSAPFRTCLSQSFRGIVRKPWNNSLQFR